METFGEAFNLACKALQHQMGKQWGGRRYIAHAMHVTRGGPITIHDANTVAWIVGAGLSVLKNRMTP